MPRSTRPHIVIHHDDEGATTIFSDVPVEVIEICEATPNDRVFRRQVSMVGGLFINRLIGDSPIGHIDDNSPAQRRAEAAANGGKPGLTIIESKP